MCSCVCVAALCVCVSLRCVCVAVFCVCVIAVLSLCVLCSECITQAEYAFKKFSCSFSRIRSQRVIPTGVPRCLVLCCVASCCPTLPHAVLRCLVLCCVASCCPTLPHAVLRCLMLCCVASCCAVLPHPVLQSPRRRHTSSRRHEASPPRPPIEVTDLQTTKPTPQSTPTGGSMRDTFTFEAFDQNGEAKLCINRWCGVRLCIDRW